jgi:hypothetical protein
MNYQREQELRAMFDMGTPDIGNPAQTLNKKALDRAISNYQS